MRSALFPLFVLFTCQICFAESKLLQHYQTITSDPDQEIYDRLTIACPTLTAAVDSGADSVELTRLLQTEIKSLEDIRIERKKNRQLGRGREGLPPDYSDRLCAILLVATLPEIDIPTIKIKKQGNVEVSFGSTFYYYLNADLGGIDQLIDQFTPVRDIANLWVQRSTLSYDGQSNLSWGINNSLRSGSLKAARTLISTPVDAPIWENPANEKATGFNRELILRIAISAIRRWGDQSDLPALLLIFDNPKYDIKSNTFRTGLRDRTLSAILEMLGESPTDYDFVKLGDYKFLNEIDQSAARNKFQVYRDFIPVMDQIAESKQATLELSLPRLKQSFQQINSLSVAEKQQLVAALEQSPIKADQLLTALSQEASLSEEQTELVQVLQFRLRCVLVDQFNLKMIDPEKLTQAKSKYDQICGESPEAAQWFADMATAQPGLINLYESYLSTDQSPNNIYLDALKLAFIRAESNLANQFKQKSDEFVRTEISAGRQPRRPNIVYPGNLDDTYLASLAALFFLRSDQALHFKTPLFGQTIRPLISGIGLGVYNQKNPIQVFTKTQGARGQAFASLIQAACLAAKTDKEYSNAFQLVLRYRYKETGKQLADKICSPDFQFENESSRGQLLQLAIHCYFSFGTPNEDLEKLLVLLDEKQQIRLGGYKKGQERKYHELREFALMAAKRVSKQKLEIKESGRVTGYCPVKRFIGLDIVKDTSQWTDIKNTVSQWVDTINSNSK